MSSTIQNTIILFLYVVTLIIFISVWSNDSSARFLDHTFLACLAVENHDVIGCLFCLIRGPLHDALQFFVNVLDPALSLVGAGGISNPVGVGNDPIGCVNENGTTTTLTIFYAVIWIILFLIVLSVFIFIVQKIETVVYYITFPFYCIYNVFKYITTDPIRPIRQRKHKYNRLSEKKV